jgi:2-oxo-hept-3-ene-1,7-dioate hydratase
MPLSLTQQREIAEELYRAEISRNPVPLISERYPTMTLEDAYLVQAVGMQMRIADGRSVIGHKVGLTSRTMQRALSIEQPDFGVLYDDMLFENCSVPVNRFIRPRVEIELAFILGTDLAGPNCDMDEVLAATAEIRPCFEILDSRVEMMSARSGRRRTIVDTVADNAADAGLVLGGPALKIGAVDLQWVAAMCFQNGKVEDSGVSGSVLGHPARAVAWLANNLHRYGVSLRAGEIVLSGSFIDPLNASRGDAFEAVFHDHGDVSCTFI